MRDLDAAPDPDALLDRLERFHALAPVADGELLAREALALPTAAKVLEVGCGPGAGLASLEAAGCEAYGVDISERALERARAAAPRSRFVRADATALPFAGASFDGVRLTRVLQHVPRPEQALREAHRVLRPGRHVVVTEGLQRVSGVDDDATTRVRGWVGWFLAPLLARAGFDDVRLQVHRDAVPLDDPTAVDYLGAGEVAGGSALEITVLICSGLRRG